MTGKKMPYQCVEVIIKLKSPPLSYFGEETSDRIVLDYNLAHLDIRIDVKSPGLNDNVEPATLTHRYPDWLGVDGYEKLFFDINGDQSHFVHSEEVLESWRIVDDLLCTGDSGKIRTAPYIYKEGTWGPWQDRSNCQVGLSRMIHRRDIVKIRFLILGGPWQFLDGSIFVPL